MTPKQKEIAKAIEPANSIKVNNWLTSEGLALLEGLSRDGFGYQEIAKMIGISESTLRRWRVKHQSIDEALRRGREVSDYMVENALFKSALGYRTKEVNIRTRMEDGIITEVIKDVSFKDQAPNMRAIEVWLYNRKPELWKRDGGSRLDELIEDSSIQITVNKGLPEEEEQKQDNWPEEVNQDITIEKPNNNKPNKNKVKLNDNIEVEAKPKQKQSRESGFDEFNNQARINKALPSDNIHRDKEEELNKAFKGINNMKHSDPYDQSEEQEDLDEWPDDWEELIDISNKEEEEAGD